MQVFILKQTPLQVKFQACMLFLFFLPLNNQFLKFRLTACVDNLNHIQSIR